MLFIPQSISNAIISTKELGSNNKAENHGMVNDKEYLYSSKS